MSAPADLADARVEARMRAFADIDRVRRLPRAVVVAVRNREPPGGEIVDAAVTCVTGRRRTLVLRQASLVRLADERCTSNVSGVCDPWL